MRSTKYAHATKIKTEATVGLGRITATPRARWMATVTAPRPRDRHEGARTAICDAAAGKPRASRASDARIGHCVVGGGATTGTATRPRLFREGRTPRNDEGVASKPRRRREGRTPYCWAGSQWTATMLRPRPRPCRAGRNSWRGRGKAARLGRRAVWRSCNDGDAMRPRRQQRTTRQRERRASAARVGRRTVGPGRNDGDATSKPRRCREGRMSRGQAGAARQRGRRQNASQPREEDATRSGGEQWTANNATVAIPCRQLWGPWARTAAAAAAAAKGGQLRTKHQISGHN